ncbi:MAG TPA: hypothetical protein G4O14_02810 [Anaerolineae bacterium]|nr:hypothetical protein [Anaerolineae bacterium]
MPNEELIPGQPVPAPDQQITPDPAPAEPVVAPPVTPAPATPPAGSTPDGFVEKGRFDGAIRKIEELTIASRSHAEELKAKDLEIERLTASLSSKDIEKTVAVGERDKNLETALTENQALLTEVQQLRAYKMKVETAREMGRPELIQILDKIPDLADAEVLKSVMADFVKFREDGIKERETALLSGITPPAPPIHNAPEKPTTGEGWSAYVNKFPIGSKERQAAFDEWGDWQIAQAK